MKLLPLSEYIDHTFPRLAISHLSARIKESLSKKNVTSICTTLLAIQVNKAPYLLTSLRLCFTINGPNMSTPQWVNGAVLVNLQAGRSAIFCSPILHLNLRQSTHLNMKFVTAEFAPTIQYPELFIWFNFIPRPP